MSSPAKRQPKLHLPRHSLWANLGFWGGLLVGVTVPTGLGIWAWKELLQPVAQDICQNVWQAETAAIRISCAELRAEDQNADALLEAIRIAEGVGMNDPLRVKSDRLMEQWSRRVLELSEAAFQDGNLPQAVEWVKQLPAGVPVSQQAEQRMQQWQSTWARAEDLYQQAEEKLDREQWSEAMAIGRELLAIDNRYWATNRYQDLMDRLAAARGDRNWTQLTAGKPTSKPSKTEDLMARWQREANVADQNRLKQARSLAAGGELDGMRSAISEASLVLSDSPRYAEAQGLIKTWQRQVDTAEDQVYLNRALDLAQNGDSSSLRSAINEVDWITSDRPLYPQAQTLMRQWNERLEQLRNPAIASPNNGPGPQNPRVQTVSNDPPANTSGHTEP